jgi:aminoglycoside phosphotransferase family enzyme/predicted kinase
MNFDDIPSDINPLGLFSKQAFQVAQDQIRLIQTHISWVVLAGQYAYKLKKPVAFPFLDYGALQKRQQFCIKEMERNKSWAGSLYIDIVGLHGEQGEVVLGEPTAEVEWCLRMHRFDQADCLLKKAELGKIPSAWIDDLAQHLVSAHSVASVAASDTLWGTTESLSLQLEQCCLDIEAAARKMDVEIDVKATDGRLQARLKKIESIMQRRKQLGFIRECHGDLHLGNVIRWQGHTVGFDAIEFNPDFYWIDVWNDVAFTIMDLDWHGQADNASRLMNAYAEGCGDYGGLELLSVFTSYRALVRARIAALRVQQSSVQSEVARGSLQEMRGYIELAQGYLQKVSPKLWITHGVSGSGKSMGSERCVEEHRAIRIRTDVERKRLAGIDRFTVGDAAIYSGEFTRATYERCIELARVVITAGYSVVVDGTFLKRWQRDLAYGLANELAVEFEILDFDAPVEILRQRIMKRAADPSDATLEVLERQLADREELSVTERSFVKEM